jgi:hypothetical protein
MAIQTRSSVLCIKTETTEGTPVAPAAASDFIALQDDFTMEAAQDSLENAELKASIGKAKPIAGPENPTAKLSHYVRHSGVEGTKPNYSEVLESVFGTETVASTEYNTIAGSSVSSVKLDTGEGVNFSRGQALLIKDAVNGYSIRPIKSVSSDDLALGFNVASAPGVGVNLGKAVTYSPANSGHKSLTVTHYVGNGGAVQMMAGAKCTEFTTDITAGELINGSFSLEGIQYFFNPITITASSKYIDFTDDTGTFAAAVSVKTFANPNELAAAIASAMNAANPLIPHTCVYSNTTGKFTLTATGAVFTLKWNTGANTANTIAPKIGFSAAADSSAALSYTSATAISLAAPYTATYDVSDPLVAKDNTCLVGGSTDNTCFQAQSVNFSLKDTRAVITSVCAESGRSGSLISAREVSVTVNALLNQFDADKFYRMQQNTETSFCYVGGTKVGGNWVPGKCFCLYVPTATVNSVVLSDADGLVAVELQLMGYVNDSGEGEVYLSFV